MNQPGQMASVLRAKVRRILAKIGNRYINEMRQENTGNRIFHINKTLSDMVSITFIPTSSRIKYSANLEKKLSGKDYSLIRNINLILELIISNTLRYNKLTSTDEIYENLKTFQNSNVPYEEKEVELDVNSIENICNIFCEGKGVLIKLKRNNECFYKLNNHVNL